MGNVLTEATKPYSSPNALTNIAVGAGYGLLGGFNFYGGASQQFGDFNLGGSAGGGNNHFGWRVSAKYKDYGAGYGRTYYGNAIGPDRLSNAQTVGDFSAYWKGGSFTFQNDGSFLGGDRKSVV